MSRFLTTRCLTTRFLSASVLAFLLLLFSSSACAHKSPTHNGDTYLIIASYNPDTKRMSDFITSFGANLAGKGDFSDVLIEDLGCKNFIYEAHTWKNQVAALLQKHEKRKIKAIVLLGQEAWASFLQLAESDTAVLSPFKEVPIFCAFTSENGINLPSALNDTNWRPVCVNMVERASSKFRCGGYVNIYDLAINIKLIKDFYPNVKQIAFVTDNTYGGASLIALIRKEIIHFPEIEFSFIDGSKISGEEAKAIIKNLRENSVLLIGTWRVNKEGQYFIRNSLEELVSDCPNLPVFSMTGSGIGTIAIGGYIPQYGANAEVIAEQIINFNHYRPDSVRVIRSKGVYNFDRRKLKELGVRIDQLPANSVIINSEDPRIDQYKDYIIIVSAISLIMVFLAIIMSILYNRNRKLRLRLEDRETELIEAKIKAEESDKLKSAFLANMSHEIRTPLNAIVGFSDILCTETLTDVEKESYNHLISQNSDILLTLINDILDISRLETGKITFSYLEIDINAVCHNVFSTTHHLNKPDIEYKFYPGRESFTLKTDPKRLMQVLINLITNANKFTEKGSITLAYTIDESQNKVLFSVTDTGCGIPEDKNINIFKRFEKLDEHKQGTGLGLAICKQIVTKLGGDIWIDPYYTDGARFYFTHPI
ncbi:MAG: ATP-binding protein [Rikenellaceae bacterium]